MRGAGSVAVRVASAAATAAASSSPVGPVVGAAAVAAAAVRVVAATTGRSTVGDNLSVALVLRRSAGMGAVTVWVSVDG
jgi:hypothetical protein